MLTARTEQFLLNEEAVTSMEYALLGALIAVVCVLAVTAVGTSTRDLYMTACNALAVATKRPPC